MTAAGPTSEELVQIRVIRARKDEVAGERAGRLLVRTTAAPVDGSANDAVQLLAAHFGVSRSAVELVAGHRSRDKTVAIRR